MTRERRSPSHPRSLDRRLFLWIYLAAAAIGILEVALASSLLERIAWVAFTIAIAAQAAKKRQDMRRSGRWMDPPSASVQANLRQRRRIIAVALPILFAIGLVIGLS